MLRWTSAALALLPGSRRTCTRCSQPRDRVQRSRPRNAPPCSWAVRTPTVAKKVANPSETLGEGGNPRCAVGPFAVLQLLSSVRTVEGASRRNAVLEARQVLRAGAEVWLTRICLLSHRCLPAATMAGASRRHSSTQDRNGPRTTLGSRLVRCPSRLARVGCSVVQPMLLQPSSSRI